MKRLVLIGVFLFMAPGFASELIEPLTPVADIEKVRKRLYPGGRDEEDLKVLAALPESLRKTDERAIQKEVYKTLFNQELTDSPDEEAEPEAGH
jgi:hypothetical protein